MKTKTIKKKAIAKPLITAANHGDSQDIPQIQSYTLDEDARIRGMAAVVLGKLMAEKPVDAEVKKGIQWLGTLSQDSDSWVRKQAIQSLGKVGSQAAVPFLQSALQDPDLEIVAMASAIMQSYKGYGASADSARENLPSNSALKAQQPPDSTTPANPSGITGD